MKLTQEQQEIIQSTGDIKINAVAGSGKTTTVIEYAKARPSDSRILYLAFNKSVKLEASKKFRDKGLDNVTVETAHSLAYKHVVFKKNYSVRNHGYKTQEIVELLGLRTSGEKHSEYILANHIIKFITYFCNSDKQRIKDLNYLDVVFEPKAKKFVESFYNVIQNQARVILNKMDTQEIEVIHDFYLKKFQLSHPQLHYDYILFDEGQDASPAMLDVFLKQKATKVIVGDTHQQIYGWRFAVNSLEKANYKTHHLSTSFRFSQDIANLAVGVLDWKNHLQEHKTVTITGKGSTKENKIKAILARTNLGLLLKAIEYVTQQRKVKHIYFEGNINSYTYADDGASLYDVLNLYNGKKHLIKDKLIKEMNDLDELEDYIEKTEDAQLGMMLEIVREYGNEIPGIIKSIKEKHVGNEEKEKAEMIFSTVHRCKGMEYDEVEIVNDFINEEKLEKLENEIRMGGISLSKVNEEINLLYVAVTRTKNKLHIPQTLMPKDFPPSAQIQILEAKTEEEKKGLKKTESIQTSYPKPSPKHAAKEKAYSVAEAREKNKAAYQPWTNELDDELTIMFCEGAKIDEMAKHFGRTKGSVLSRIRKLELEEAYG